MADNTILDYEEATELADDDYIIMDSESGGTCKIPAKYFSQEVGNNVTNN